MLWSCNEEEEGHGRFEEQGNVSIAINPLLLHASARGGGGGYGGDGGYGICYHYHTPVLLVPFFFLGVTENNAERRREERSREKLRVCVGQCWRLEIGDWGLVYGRGVCVTRVSVLGVTRVGIPQLMQVRSYTPRSV